LPEKPRRTALLYGFAMGGKYWKEDIIKYLKFMPKSKNFIDFRV
jgi:hypothetical protein